MGEIIDLSNKREQQRQEGTKEKLEAARRIFLCSACPSKCAKCGTQLEVHAHTCMASHEEFSFCEACAVDWEIFQKVRRGEPAERQYYHNDEWVTLWEMWLKYQKAMMKYRNSKEFRRLLTELEQ